MHAGRNQPVPARNRQHAVTLLVLSAPFRTHLRVGARAGADSHRITAPLMRTPALDGVPGIILCAEKVPCGAVADQGWHQCTWEHRFDGAWRVGTTQIGAQPARIE